MQSVTLTSTFVTGCSRMMMISTGIMQQAIQVYFYIKQNNGSLYILTVLLSVTVYIMEVKKGMIEGLIRGVFGKSCLCLSGDVNLKVNPKMPTACPQSTLRG